MNICKYCSFSTKYYTEPHEMSIVETLRARYSRETILFFST